MSINDDISLSLTDIIETPDKRAISVNVQGETCKLDQDQVISNFISNQPNTQPKTQNSCRLKVCIPIGFYVKVTLNEMVPFPTVINILAVFPTHTNDQTDNIPRKCGTVKNT